MNLRDKLDRYASGPTRAPTRPEPQASPSLSAEYEHRVSVFPPHHRHGVLGVDSLGGSFPNAARMLTRSAASDALDFERIAFVDTETTGLSGGAGVCAFLVGVGYRTSAGFVVEQFLMNDFPAEPHMLRKVCETLEGFDFIASYNGRAFDIPILDGRLLLNGIRTRLADRPHLDLLHPARRLWKHRLGDCSLKSVEERTLGHTRVDDIDGWMIPEAYFRYLREGDRDSLEQVVRHNTLDVLSLACVAHMVFSAVDCPHDAPLRHGPDWYGLGTLFEQRGRTEEAAHCFERAMAVGLSEDLKHRCSRLLSLTHKRRGDWEDAVRLWQEGTKTGESAHHTLFALEELAKFYEHRRRDLRSAREVCRRAISMLEIRAALSETNMTRHLEDFEYRLRRIERKIRRQGNA